MSERKIHRHTRAGRLNHAIYAWVIGGVLLATGSTVLGQWNQRGQGTPGPDLSGYTETDYHELIADLYKKLGELERENRKLKIQLEIASQVREKSIMLSPLPRAKPEAAPDPAGEMTAADRASGNSPEFSFLPVSEWIGQKFVFLPRAKNLQKYGYQGFSTVQGRHGGQDYETCVGRVAIITSIDHDVFPRISLKLDDGRALYVTGYTSGARGIALKGLALKADIDLARDYWRGKKLWFRGDQINAIDEEGTKMEPVQIRKYSPVEVVDVTTGWYEDRPARFVLRTSRLEIRYVDVTLSGTNSNLSKAVWFRDLFLEEDPRVTHKWQNHIWHLIENARVTVGMTPEQARMAWGDPQDVNVSINKGVHREQWIYPEDRYLVFESEVLAEIKRGSD